MHIARSDTLVEAVLRCLFNGFCSKIAQRIINYFVFSCRDIAITRRMNGFCMHIKY